MSSKLTDLLRWPLAIGLTFLSIGATGSQTPALRPFLAHYISSWDVGLKVEGNASRQLQQTDEGKWLFSLKAKALVAKLSESSVMSIEGGHITPYEYQYQRKVLNRNKQVHIQFDWLKKQATTTTSNSWTMPIQAPLQDKLSVQLQLQKDLSMQASDDYTYQVAAGGQIETFQYKVHHTEQLSLPIGLYEGIKVERLCNESNQRQTFIWFAPELNFQPARIVQIEPDGKQYQMDLERLEQ